MHQLPCHIHPIWCPVEPMCWKYESLCCRCKTVVMVSRSLHDHASAYPLQYITPPGTCCLLGDTCHWATDPPAGTGYGYGYHRSWPIPIPSLGLYLLPMQVLQTHVNAYESWPSKWSELVWTSLLQSLIFFIFKDCKLDWKKIDTDQTIGPVHFSPV